MKEESTRTAEEVREEIEAIRVYREKWPCAPDIQGECDAMIRILQWVLKEES